MQDQKYPLVSLAWGLAVLGAVVVAVLLVRSQRTNLDAPLASPESPSSAPTAARSEMPSSREVAAPGSQPDDDNSPKTPPPRPVIRPAALQPAASPETLELVNRLLQPGSADGAAWKQNLQQLVQQGTNAIPAILEFLAKNSDASFDPAVQQALGYPSARMAMFDALGQIGGPEAIGALAGELKGTTDPREIATLAQSLEKLEPGRGLLNAR